MYINFDYVREAVAELENIHPFYGITFLACKRADLPIGSQITFSVGTIETEFLQEFFQPYAGSDYFYRLFRISDKLKLWVHQTKYASSTLQSIRTQSAFSAAFIHERNTADWGWEKDYVGVLRANLSFNAKQFKHQKVPTLLLACWLYRDRTWEPDTTPSDVIASFVNEFRILPEEEVLFDLGVNFSLFDNPFLQPDQHDPDAVFDLLGDPPDVEPDKGETLSLLELQDVGPMTELRFEPARRMNLLTGDNGLGKTFVLEASWWALTAQWKSPESQASPRFAEKTRPAMSFQIEGEQSKFRKVVSRYDFTTQRWKVPKERPTIEGLAIYARVDGSFAIWNPLRQQMIANQRLLEVTDLRISSEEVWDGIPGEFEGLLRDWVEWQNNAETSSEIVGTFEVFKRVLARLSPPDIGVLEPGTPVRLAFESKRVPTLKHPYGEVPIIYESAAVRRILALAYLIVWTWNEHLIYSDLTKTAVQRTMVILIDEIEAHLHPLWQRKVLPALLDVSNELSEELETQLILSTHSPLVLASAESRFDERSDGLFHLDLTPEGKVTFNQISFIRQGSVDAWLTSKVFDLRHARSFEAEEVIERAKAIQGLDDPPKNEIEQVTKDLLGVLPADDGFWSRWNYFAESHGVGV